MPRIGTVIRDVCRRPGADALPAHLEAHYGVRVAAWQCWLAVVSPKVSRIFVPDPDYIAALAREVRGSREARPA